MDLKKRDIKRLYKTMPDYSQGKIYKLVSNQTDKVYYGSTINDLHKRLYQHKQDYKRWIDNDYPYITAFEITQFDDVEIVLVKNYPCESKNELHKKVRKYIEKYQCVNKYIPGRTKEERKEQNFVCKCGCDMKLNNKYYHKHSKKHIKNMINLKGQ